MNPPHFELPSFPALCILTALRNYTVIRMTGLRQKTTHYRTKYRTRRSFVRTVSTGSDSTLA